MAEFLTTSGSISTIERIIKQAQSKLVIITPYVQLSQNFYERLKDADRRGVKLTFIYGKEDLNELELAKLNELKNIQLLFSENLHAKAYFNEQEAVISSMNLYAYSEKNREMGILIKKSVDPTAFNELVQEVMSIKDHCVVPKKPSVDFKPIVTQKNEYKKEKAKGYCIRCEERIKLNIDKRFCKDCYDEWVMYENEDYKEQCCHECGKSVSTSMAKPLCKSCFKDGEAILKFL
jgi:hypothetical protein